MQDEYYEKEAAKRIKSQNQKKEEAIDNFDGDYFGFLNNDFPCLISFDNLFFPSVNTAFQAARVQNKELSEKISQVDEPSQLWELVENIQDPENWEINKLKAMEQLLRDKFQRSKELKERLAGTVGRDLINTQHEFTEENLFWGQVQGQGQNQLGQILMQIREDIIKKIDLQKWIHCVIDVENEFLLFPAIVIQTIKDEKKLDDIRIVKKNIYFLGNLKTNDVLLAHPSISRQHACLVVDKQQNLNIIDLGSKGGTKVNGQFLEEFISKQINENDLVEFASSTRKYHIDPDYQYVLQYLVKSERELRNELTILEKIDNPNITQEDLRAVLGFSPENTVYVGNLPFQTNTRQLKDEFSEYGSIKDIQIALNKFGQSKGVALITFKTDQIARSAILKAQGKQIEGRKLKICKVDKAKQAELIEDIEIHNERNKRKKEREEREKEGKYNRDDKYGEREDRNIRGERGEKEEYKRRGDRDDIKDERRRGERDDRRGDRDNRREHKEDRRSDRDDRKRDKDIRRGDKYNRDDKKRSKREDRSRSRDRKENKEEKDKQKDKKSSQSQEKKE